MKPKFSQLERINLREAWRHDRLRLSELELVQAEHWVATSSWTSAARRQ